MMYHNSCEQIPIEIKEATWQYSFTIQEQWMPDVRVAVLATGNVPRENPNDPPTSG
jgi:hypothetical protein